MKTSNILYAAADTIETRGWQHGCGWNSDAEPTAPVCAEGALQAAMGIDHYDNIGFRDFYASPALAALRRHVGTDTVMYWNDDLFYPDHGNPGTTVAEREEWAKARVVAALRAAAVIEAAREEAADREQVES